MKKKKLIQRIAEQFKGMDDDDSPDFFSGAEKNILAMLVAEGYLKKEKDPKCNGITTYTPTFQGKVKK